MTKLLRVITRPPTLPASRRGAARGHCRRDGRCLCAAGGIALDVRSTGIACWWRRGSPSATASALASAAATDMPGMSMAPESPAASMAADMDALAEAVVKRFPRADRGRRQPAAGRRGSMATRRSSISRRQPSSGRSTPEGPVDAVGYNGTWPGPLMRVDRGRPRAHRPPQQPRRDRPASTSTAWTCPTRWTACRSSPSRRSSRARRSPTSSRPRHAGSHMYHSHHNATEQVGAGLLGAFIVEPSDPAQRYQRRPATYVLDQQRRPRRLHHQRQGLPGDRADRRASRARRSSSAS